MGGLVNGACLLALLWFNVFVVNYVAAREGVAFNKDKEAEKTFRGFDKGGRTDCWMGHCGGFGPGGIGDGIGSGIGKGRGNEIGKGDGIGSGIGKGGGNEIGKGDGFGNGIGNGGSFGSGIGKGGGIGHH